ncbi:MAG TPA: helix-turn-helix transcriptional regulator [Candidatus Saccharimonadales bacterium]|nr:helix-turn-helix transcriptional regulator [Candidatus Saccharimonadales bacterium]
MKPPTELKNLKLLGKRIADLRKQQGLTQEQLAEKTGMAAHSLAYIEQGQRFPRYLTTFQKLAKSMNVPLYEFFKGL